MNRLVERNAVQIGKLNEKKKKNLKRKEKKMKLIRYNEKRKGTSWM